jgi:flavodoxin
MNALVVYHSQFGNTQMVAEAIGEGLQKAVSVRLLRFEQLTADDLAGVDLVIAGTPTHKMNLPGAVRSVFDGLPRGILGGVPVAAFDTSYRMSAFLARFTASKKLARKLRKLGGKRIVPPETFHVSSRTGPLYEGEVERGRDWAISILGRLGADGV